jgi:ribosomal protein S18 acetylase RimI-like enzyme
MVENKKETKPVSGGELRIINLTRYYLIRNMDRFLEMEPNWTDTGQPPWTKENFLLDLPLKWELSFAAEIGSSIAGYIIGSEHTQKLSRVNKIVVDSFYQRKGIGEKLMNRYFEACQQKGIKKSEIKAMVGYEPANNLYTKLGYQHIGVAEGTDGKFRNVCEKRLE